MKGEKYLYDFKEVKGNQVEFKKLLSEKYNMTAKSISNNYNLLKKQVTFTEEELIQLPANITLLKKHESIDCEQPGMLKMILFKDMIVHYKGKIFLSELIKMGFGVREIKWLENNYGKFPIGE